MNQVVPPGGELGGGRANRVVKCARDLMTQPARPDACWLEADRGEPGGQRTPQLAQGQHLGQAGLMA